MFVNETAIWSVSKKDKKREEKKKAKLVNPYLFLTLQQTNIFFRPICKSCRNQYTSQELIIFIQENIFSNFGYEISVSLTNFSLSDYS